MSEANPEPVEGGGEQADEDFGDVDGSDGCANCDVPEGEMLVVKDQNFDYPWKGGNKYSRICPECGSRTFTAGSYWESKNASAETVAYVIPKGQDSARPLYRCPYTEEFLPEGEEPCGEEFLGEPHDSDQTVDACPNCERELAWE